MLAILVLMFPAVSSALMYASVTLGSMMHPEEAAIAFGPRTTLTPPLSRLVNHPALVLIAAGYFLFCGMYMALAHLPRPDILWRVIRGFARVLALGVWSTL
jgi:hypothetical protein